MSDTVLSCSFEIAEQPALESLMQNNTSLAQKLLVCVMKHLASARESSQSDLMLPRP